MGRHILVRANRNGAWATSELVEAIKDAVTDYGFDVIVQYSNRKAPRGYDFIIQVGARYGINQPDSAISVFVDTDHIELREQRGSSLDYSAFTRSLHFFDYKEDLTHKNIYYCPIGYSRHFDTTIPHWDLRDSFHMGRYNGHRSRKRFRMKHKLWSPGLVHGAERDAYIVTSKININSRASEDYWFTPLHAALIVQKGKLYMQDDVGKDDYHFYKPYLVLFTEEDFKEKYDYWLTHDKKRREFEQFIHEDIKQNHPFGKYFYAAMGDLLEDYR